jgi:hypothetical protein
MSQPPGPKELALRAMRENNASKRPAPSKAELRQQIAKVKGGGGRKNKGGGRGR